MDDKSIGFDYKLKPGKLKTRNAISILEINEYPEDVITEAKALAARMDEINRSKKITE